jgi:hypothetical protein
MSWKPEVQTDLTGQWHGNGLRFLTHQEAEATARNLMRRWLSVRSTRAVECVDPVNYHYIEGRLEAANALTVSAEVKVPQRYPSRSVAPE